MSNVSDLGTVLDEMSARTHKVAPGLPIVLSELGWKTKPPNPYDAIELSRQARYMNVADHLAYANPRVVAQTQFLVHDAGPLRENPVGSRLYWRTWQSGFFYADGRPKPSYRAYLMPIDVTPPRAGGGRVRVWGQLRFLAPGTRGVVQLQFQPRGSSRWLESGDPIVITNPAGFYEVSRPPAGPGAYRAVWSRNGAPRRRSRVVVVPL